MGERRKEIRTRINLIFVINNFSIVFQINYLLEILKIPGIVRRLKKKKHKGRIENLKNVYIFLNLLFFENYSIFKSKNKTKNKMHSSF